MDTPSAREISRKENNLILVIDDDEIMRLSCEQILTKAGHCVEVFDNGQDGIRRIRQVRPPVLIVDIKMPELDGFEVINLARQIDQDLVIVVITGYATIETAVDAMKAGAYDFLPKPFTPNELRLIIDRGLERWRLTKETQRLRREKEEVEHKFVTLVTHQLKAPLVAVKQYLDVLQHSFREQLPEKSADWVIRSQLRLGEMLSIIEDWLALARIDHGSFCDRNATTDLAGLVAEIVHDQQQLPASNDVTIRIDLAPDMPRVIGDSTGIALVISNLVSNAVKYNRPSGTVLVESRFDGRSVELKVKDTGIGIPEESIPRLFQEFYRVRTRETHDIPGTGLGLVICKRIVTELGGSIEVESRVGEGTVFCMRLPVAEEKSVSDAHVCQDSASGENK